VNSAGNSYNSSPAWYQSPQYAPQFSSPLGGLAMGGAGAAGNGIGRLAGNSQSQFGNMYGSAMSGISSDAASAAGGIDRAGSQAFGGLGNAMSAIQKSPVLDAMTNNYNTGLSSISSGMGSGNAAILGGMRLGTSGLTGLSRDAYSNMNAGMNQLYGNLNNQDFLSPMTSALQGGAGHLRDIGRQLQSGWNTFNSGMDSGYQQYGSQFGDTMDRGLRSRKSLRGGR
jgi:hypothetical protein